MAGKNNVEAFVYSALRKASGEKECVYKVEKRNSVTCIHVLDGDTFSVKVERIEGIDHD